MAKAQKSVNPDELARAARIATRLAAQGTEHVAFVIDDETVFYAVEPYPRTARAPHSAITDLVQALHALDPAQAMRRARLRIYSTINPTAMCRGMVKVAAHRLTAPLATTVPATADAPVAPDTEAVRDTPTAAAPGPALRLERLARPLAVVTMGGASGPRQNPDAWLAAARALATTVPRAPARHASDRQVAALLISATGELLASALNTGARNRTLHAEVNLLQGYFAKASTALPPGARIVTTLKPCRMCAAMIWHCAADPESLEVIYGEHDPGANARVTILDADSPDRRDWLAAPKPALLKLQLERHHT